MCFIERETHLVILKFMEIFSDGKKQCSGSTKRNLMKSCFSVKFMQFFGEKMLHVVIDRYFSLWVSKIFLN